jgi:hypothetical protein
MLKSKKFWKRFFIYTFLTPLLLFFLSVGLVYWQQDNIRKELINTLNEDFKGYVELGDSHVSLFANFPYISIDLENLKIYEDKAKSNPPILAIHDAYLGFNVWTLITGNFEIKTIKLENGHIDLVQHPNGELNLINALSSEKKIENPEEEFHMDIKSIKLNNVDITKLNEANNIKIEAYVNNAQCKFKTSKNHLMIGLNSKFLLNVIESGDTTFFKHKHFEIETEIDLDKTTHLLTIQPSEIILEHALFKMEGTVDIDDDANMDIKFHGNKPNFDLLMAFAPEEIIPVLKKYDQKGKIFFEATVKGKSLNGHQPLVNAEFGCENAFFKNNDSNKKLDELYFKGRFTNGEKRTTESMEFSLMDFSAKPEAGTFTGYLIVKNFNSPEIDMRIKSDFDLDFLSKFLNLTTLKDLKGYVSLTMNFHDIIDLNYPERAIEKLNESYFTELVVTNLSFRSPDFHLPFNKINLKATMDGHEAKIEYFKAKIGDSDIDAHGSISDLPAILHHTNIPVKTTLNIKSDLLDLFQLTDNKKPDNIPFDEQIKNLSLKLSFTSSAKAFTESPTLPTGEFFIEDLYAKLKHYPHTLHDFHADIFIDEHDFRIIDFTGVIDKSDFHVSGKLRNYDLWFQNNPYGDTKIEFSINSKLLQLQDLFAYGGENYVPEDYRHEEFKNLKFSAHADLHFKDSLYSSDLYIDDFSALMKIHPMKMENFSGRVHYENEHLLVENFSGKLGKSKILANLQFYTGKNKALKKKDNYLHLKSPRLDFDELFNYNPPPASKSNTPVDHENVFNIYDLPFTDMLFTMDVEHLNYHKYLIHSFYSKLRTSENHYIYIDTMRLEAAGGKISLSGYLNGSDRNKIYFSPHMHLHKINLDKLMFKFDNLGQDYLVSDNLQGKLSGKITGNIHLHADLVPVINDSEIHLDIEVTEGKLLNFKPMQALSDYFKDKNLNKILFDTLKNHIDMKNGTMNIPNMVINSSLGFIEMSGKQDMSLNMEYYFKIPVKLVTEVARQKLFGDKKEEEIDPEREDEIIYKNEHKKVRYIYLKLKGNENGYNISLGKEKNAK